MDPPLGYYPLNRGLRNVKSDGLLGLNLGNLCCSRSVDIGCVKPRLNIVGRRCAKNWKNPSGFKLSIDAELRRTFHRRSALGKKLQVETYIRTAAKYHRKNTNI